jgi:vacuolar-type H+-ATPase subunit I/STV1
MLLNPFPLLIFLSIFQGEEISKNVFIVFFQGERAQTKARKICESFGATTYPCPETAAGRLDLRDQVQKRLDDLRAVSKGVIREGDLLHSSNSTSSRFLKEQRNIAFAFFQRSLLTSNTGENSSSRRSLSTTR